MLEIETHGDVQRLQFSTWRSRAAGYSVSAYAVRGVVVDAAFDDVGDEFLAWIAANKPAGVIVTHAHDDHGGNAERLAREGVRMQMQSDTAAFLATPQRRGLHRRWAWGGLPMLVSPWTSFESPGLEMIAARGHSPDHHVVWDAERETLFAADLFLGVKVKVAHAPHRENVRQQVTSIRRILDLKPKRIFDAHKGLLKEGGSLLTAKANWIEDTCGRIDGLVAKGWNDVRIAHDLFGPEPTFTHVTMGDWSHRNFVASVRSTGTIA